jgi:hypothetical protein
MMEEIQPQSFVNDVWHGLPLLTKDGFNAYQHIHQGQEN